jgi:hypothetical protein
MHRVKLGIRLGGAATTVGRSGARSAVSFSARQRLALVGVVLAVSLIGLPGSFGARRVDLPARLDDASFWQMVTSFSEPNGFFNSDNLISNEDTFQYVIPELTRIVKPGGVYVGVGPDQNFTYIAAVAPGMAFIPDVRRGNMLVHLMYKALFELSPSRGAFLSRLFSRAAPPGLAADATVDALMTAFLAAPPDRALYQANYRAITELLTKRHGFALSAEDLGGIDFAYSSFFAAGPRLTFVSNGGGGGRNRYPTYAELQTATDMTGVARSFLATDAAFKAVKTLEEKNLIVPLVGNFAGPKAIRQVGAYLRERGATVTTFYTSNVEQYLFQDRLWDDFRANVTALPLDETSTFIRSCFNNCSSPGGSRAVTLLDSMPRLLQDATMGRVQSYWDVLNHSRRP